MHCRNARSRERWQSRACRFREEVDWVYAAIERPCWSLVDDRELGDEAEARRVTSRPGFDVVQEWKQLQVSAIDRGRGGAAAGRRGSSGLLIDHSPLT